MKEIPPCFICEKHFKKGTCPNWIELSFETGDVALIENLIPEEKSQGWHPVGSACYKKLKRISKEIGSKLIPSEKYYPLQK